ncbi:hydroxyacid dehydrogenase [Candidatus Gottesmanbacteria bacterium]|nr:hydroxyacid dehydrogenase [Candidatus Gottesmanbacteria bacterium]
MDKIVFFELEKWEEEYIRKVFPTNNNFIYRSDNLTENNIAEVSDTNILSTFIYSTLNQQLLSKLPKLRFIATRSTGFDHIDISYCKKNNVTVSNVPTYGIETIAEHTFALILAFSRKIIPSIEQTKRGDFSLDRLRGFELAGKTLGIIGFGHIGKRVVQLAKTFQMKIIVHTQHPDENIAQQWGIQFIDLTTLLQTSDIVSIHAPLTSTTKHLLNKTNILNMKKGAFLINTARGAIVETEAIVLALEKGILSGVGLDVLEEECIMKEERELLTKEFLQTCDLKTQLLNHVLLTKENVFITPHNAFNSHEALKQILDVTIENIKGFLDGKPQNIV